MLELLHDLWNRAQAELATAAGRAAFDAWLADLRPLALERGVCYLEAKSRLVCERVERLYRPLIEEALTREFGTNIAVAVVPVPEALLPDAVEVGPTRPVVDDSNRTAFLVLRALVEGRELPSGLFLFHGPSGAGKTFLLRWWRQQTQQRVKRFDGRGLVKAFQACLRDGRVPQLRAELAGDAPLLVDEVHRVSGHTRIQRELRGVLEERQQAGKLVLLASRWHPRDIWRLDPGLQSLMVSGMVVRLDLPGPQARLTFLRALEGSPSRNGRAADIEDLARRADGGYGDVRRTWSIDRQAQPVRQRYLQLVDPGKIFERVCRHVCERLAVEREALAGKSQGRRVSFARQVLAHLCVREGLSRAEVGRWLGGRSRASVSYMTKRLERRMAESADVRRQVEGLL